MDLIKKDKTFYKAMFSIAIPVTIQNLISSSLNMVDTLMVTKLGSTNVAAVGQANQVFFLLTLLLFGISSGASIFIAQFWGKRDRINIRRVLGLAIILGVSLSLIFTFAALLFSKQIMRILINDAEVIALGSKYLKIVCISYIFTAITYAYSGACRSVRQAKLPMLISFISILLNTLLNYTFIFGNFGFKAMGIEGAAIATVIARMIESFLIVSIIYRDEGNVLKAKIRELTDISSNFVKKFIHTTLPVIMNEGMWSLGVVMYSIAYASGGKEATAAVQVAITIQNIFMVLSLGLASACATMIGNKIGSGEEEEGILYAKKFCVIGAIAGICLGLILYLSSPYILKIFSSTSPQLYETSKKVLAVISVFIPCKLFTTVMIVGVFRGGGDTKYSMMLEVGCVWLIGVPFAFIGALVFKLPVYWVVACAYTEEIIKTLLGMPRLISKKWVKNIVEDI
ncbi:MATE efflux family protein [Gottschalkia acidurici 9a]|uniref:MATE efflux family protein n=1 Tax=Gottschalkia acidurici (strain ATCC 7906 / DSM 604 / BCRC 14475 / CIP 104303 / KCTC 5404 / NCIMB 10678 / 9a) TaxID=1128398 RepID=K0AUC0_GOTA9|nr:MATE family efflux transporter [Gottschalkia acidurici]AFS77423.1 MATE efflux family protein [Gottschalkia acidurici 9a]